MNLFFITAPYQVVNALEAVHHFQMTENHLRVIETGHFTRPQFESVIEPDRWASIGFHGFRYRLTDRDFGLQPPKNRKERLLELSLVFDQIIKRLKAERIARSIGPVNCLVLGNYRRNYDGHMRHLANRLKYNHIYLLDVGTDTLRINSDRQVDKGTSNAIRESESNGWNLKQQIKHKLVEWDNRGAESVTFFTAYNLNPAPGDHVVRNNYAYLRSVVSGARASNKVLFVGQPLVDQGYITKETFKDTMAWIKKYLAGQGLVYISHPRESAMQLAIVSALGIPVERFAAPFEYAVSFSGERPLGIASFFSSAVENSATIFGSTINLLAFRLPDTVLLKDRDSVRQVYSQYAANHQSSIRVLDVPRI